MRSRSVRAALAAALLSALIAAPSASAADPGHWVETGISHGPLNYFQGVTSDLDFGSGPRARARFACDNDFERLSTGPGESRPSLPDRGPFLASFRFAVS